MELLMSKDNFNLGDCCGIVHLNVYKKGELISTEEHNLIVNNASKVLARLIGQQGVYADKALTKIRFSDGNYPVSVTKTDLDGTNKYTKSITSVTYDGTGAPYDVQFNFTLDAAEFNGYNIWQFGLFSGEQEMFSMLSRNPEKTHPIEKDVDVTIDGWWKIQFRNSA
jgi:hypothetical protein